MSDADDRVDALYDLDPGEFIAARDALAKALRAGKNREAAAEVKKLRRPTVAAWALNQLSRRHRDDVAGLVELGRRLAQAQDRALAGSAEELREVGRDRMARVRSLTKLADGILRDAGGATHHDEVVGTLTAASADPDAGERLLAGRLAEALPAPSGFFGGPAVEPAGAAPTEPSPREGGTKAGRKAGRRGGTEPGADGPGAPDAAAEERSRALAEASAIADRAEGEAEDAAKRAEEAKAAAAGAGDRVDALKVELEEARRAADDADDLARAARRAAREAAEQAGQLRRKADELAAVDGI